MNFNKRINAIAKVYGLVPVIQKKVIKIENEEFSPWYVFGYLSFGDLMKDVSLNDILKLYESGE